MLSERVSDMETNTKPGMRCLVDVAKFKVEHTFSLTMYQLCTNMN